MCARAHLGERHARATAVGNKVSVTPLTKLCWLDNECASRVPATGSYREDPRTGNSDPQVLPAPEPKYICASLLPYRRKSTFVTLFNGIRGKVVSLFFHLKKYHALRALRIVSPFYKIYDGTGCQFILPASAIPINTIW